MSSNIDISLIFYLFFNLSPPTDLTDDSELFSPNFRALRRLGKALNTWI